MLHQDKINLFYNVIKANCKADPSWPNESNSFILTKKKERAPNFHFFYLLFAIFLMRSRESIQTPQVWVLVINQKP